MRPCQGQHPDPRPDVCRPCWLFVTDGGYCRHWGGDPKQDLRPGLPPPAMQQPVAVTASPCRHLGGPTGETRECESCQGRVRLKVMACAVYEVCTVGRKVDGLACCANGTCPGYEPRRATGGVELG